MTLVEFMKLETSVTKNIKLKILKLTIHFLGNINVINVLFSQCDWCEIKLCLLRVRNNTNF